MEGVLRALTSAIDAKDPYTCGHSERVAQIAVRLARKLGCNRQSLHTVFLAGLLHDIGKIGIDDNVLRKPGKLSAAEYEHIKLVPKLGHKILRDLKQLSDVTPIVLHHHETFDGSGYPDGLRGEGIPLLARIVAVADAVDAMASERPYRAGMSDDKIDMNLSKGSGTQWDPAVVDAFFAIREDLREFGLGKRQRRDDEVPHYM
jgi:putative nucleotidyltransferase with HDIG domain